VKGKGDTKKMPITHWVETQRQEIY